MTIDDIIQSASEGTELSIEGVPFVTESSEEIQLSSGERVYYAYAESGAMLSIDPTNEECHLLERCDEEMDMEEDLQVYDGKDYEFSTEIEGRIVVDEELTDGMNMRDYEASNGRVLRIVEYLATGDIYIYEGRVVAEDEIAVSA